MPLDEATPQLDVSWPALPPALSFTLDRRPEGAAALDHVEEQRLLLACAESLPCCALPPPAALRALAGGTTTAALARDLERDPMLAGAVEWLLRSPVYACDGAGVAELLEDAGPRAPAAVVEAAVELHVYRAPGFTDIALRARHHAAAVAHAAAAIARVAGADPFDAFLLGLFHDAGIGAALGAISAAPDVFGRPHASALAQLVGAVHEHAGRAVARSYGVPTRVAELVASHHPAIIDDRTDPLLAALVTAENLAVAQGFAIDVAETPTAFDVLYYSAEAGLRALGLGRLPRARISIDVGAALRALRASL